MITKLKSKGFILLGIITLFISCNNKPKAVKRKPVDFEAIRPKSAPESPTKDSIQDTIRTELVLFEHDSINMHFDSLIEVEDLHFLNRFTEINRKKSSNAAQKKHWLFWQLYNKKQVVEFRKWDFKDSTTRSLAFYNWIDNFGEDRLSFKLFEPKNLGKKNLLILINTKSIMTVESALKIDKTKWEMYRNISTPKDSTIMEIYQTKNKPCMWYVKDKEGKITPVKKQNESH